MLRGSFQRVKVDNSKGMGRRDWTVRFVWHVSEFKYLWCVLDESCTDEAECRRKVASGRMVPGAIRSLVNGKVFQFECVKVLHETFLVYVVMQGNERILWKEKERSRIRTVQMDNLRGLLGIKRMDKIPNLRIRELCGVMNEVGERIDEGCFPVFRPCRENREL